MRTWLCLAWLAMAGAGVTGQAVPTDWIDRDTGHRVVRLTGETGGSTLYFHDNAFSPEGNTLIVNTPGGIAKADVAAIGTAGASLTVVAPAARGGYVARRARDIYSGGRGGPIVATNLDTGKTREVAYARGLINADATLSVAKNGNAADPEGKYPRPPVRPLVPQLQRMFPGKTMSPRKTGWRAGGWNAHA